MDMAVDARGKLWGVTLSNQVIYYSKTNKKWYDAKFPKHAISIATGPACHTYVLGYPLSADNKSYSIYMRDCTTRQWSAIEGIFASNIAVGAQGTLFITTGSEEIFYSPPNPTRVICDGERRAEILEEKTEVAEMDDIMASDSSFMTMLDKCAANDECKKKVATMFGEEEKGEVEKGSPKKEKREKRQARKMKKYKKKLSACVRGKVKYQSKYSKCKADKGALELYLLRCQ